MQVYLFQEREHGLRLFAENDRLKVYCTFYIEYFLCSKVPFRCVLCTDQFAYLYVKPDFLMTFRNSSKSLECCSDSSECTAISLTNDAVIPLLDIKPAAQL